MTQSAPLRPRLIRNKTNIDEKMATFFVDKVMRAAAADLEADQGIEAALSRHGHSLGNVIGQQRFLDRMARHAGCSTVYLAGYPSKKAFLMLRDILHVYDNRLMITRTVLMRKARHGVECREDESIVITRHALIRMVERIQIGSVEDVFGLLRHLWLSVERLTLSIGSSHVTTPGTRCWVLPMVMLSGLRMGLLVSCPAEDEPLSLVTVLRPYMIPETFKGPLDEYQAVLADKTITETARDAAILALLPRLLM